MRKVKRKYTRKIAPEPISDSVKEESNIIPQAGEVAVTVGGIMELGAELANFEEWVLNKPFTFNDLPLSVQTYVNGIIKNRKARGLPDDSKMRKERAIKYFRGDKPR